FQCSLLENTLTLTLRSRCRHFNSSRRRTDAGGRSRMEVTMTSVAAEYEHMEIQQQYSEGVNNRWDTDEWDNENSSARLFERSRIKALA
ncbi:hypothetical protein JOB18_005992, partial [Solea senegalensis]